MRYTADGVQNVLRVYPFQTLYEYFVEYEKYPYSPEILSKKSVWTFYEYAPQPRSGTFMRVHGLVRTRYPPRRLDTVAQCWYKHVARSRLCVRVCGRRVFVYPVMCGVRLRCASHERRNFLNIMEITLLDEIV